MKILIVGVGSNPGGIEAFMRNYTSVLSSDMQFDFFSLEPYFCDKEMYEAAGSEVYCLKSAQFRQAKEYHRELKEYFDKHKGVYDVIWLNSGDLVNIMPIALRAQKYEIKRIIIHAHSNNVINMGKKYYFYRFMHAFYRHKVKHAATDYWACSEAAGEFFFKKSLRKSDNYHIISNAIDSSLYVYNEHVRQNYREQFGVEGKLLIGNVGGLAPQKNQSFLIDIFGKIFQKNSDYRLIIVGQGKEKNALFEKVKRLGLSDYVIFTGARKDIGNILQAMDLFVFPSLFEGLGMALIEAQVSGLKCFASDCVIPKQADISGLVSFIDLKKSADEWADIILDTPLTKERQKYSDCAVCAGFDIRHEAAKLEMLLKR